MVYKGKRRNDGDESGHTLLDLAEAVIDTHDEFEKSDEADGAYVSRTFVRKLDDCAVKLAMAVCEDFAEEEPLISNLREMIRNLREMIRAIDTAVAVNGSGASMGFRFAAVYMLAERISDYVSNVLGPDHEEVHGDESAADAPDGDAEDAEKAEWLTAYMATIEDYKKNGELVLAALQRPKSNGELVVRPKGAT